LTFERFIKLILKSPQTKYVSLLSFKSCLICQVMFSKSCLETYHSIHL